MRQAVEQMQHSSGPVPSDTTINSLMQTAASTDAGLVIMNVHGFQRLLSGGNTPVFHRDAIEEIQMPSPKKKDVCYTCEQHDQFESQGLAHIPGCAESRSGCCRAMGVETVAVRSKLELPLRKNCAEELQLKKTAASCESKDKHIQIERVEVNTEHTRGTKTKEGTDVLSSACQNMSTGDATASTEGSRKILVSNVEDEANRCRSGSIDCSDEETSFVKL